MSSYYNIKGLKVRLSDHEPNYSMDRMRGHNDIELYIKDACGNPIDVEAYVESIVEKGLFDLTISDFADVIRDAAELQNTPKISNNDEAVELHILKANTPEKQAFIDEVKGIDKEALKQALANVHNFKARKSLIASISNGLSNATLNKLANENSEFWK